MKIMRLFAVSELTNSTSCLGVAKNSRISGQVEEASCELTVPLPLQRMPANGRPSPSAFLQVDIQYES